jgi:hypothetical protein
MQQLVPSVSSSSASPRKSGFKSQSLAVIEKLLEGAVSLVSQFNPTDAQGDLVALGVEFWTWVRRRLLFTSATINSIATQQNISLQSPALLPVTSVLASLLSSIQVQPDFVTGNDSIDILVLLQNLLQSFRTFAAAYDSPHTRVPLPLALLFFHSIYTVIESDEDAFRDLQMEEEVQEIGFIRLPQSWLTPDAVHVLPVIARLVAILGLSMNEAEGLFAASLLHFLKDRCAHSFAYIFHCFTLHCFQTQCPCSQKSRRILLRLCERHPLTRCDFHDCTCRSAVDHMRFRRLDGPAESFLRVRCRWFPAAMRRRAVHRGVRICSCWYFAVHFNRASFCARLHCRRNSSRFFSDQAPQHSMCRFSL